jgi:uncharacterized protein
MSSSQISRRKFLLGALLAAPGAVLGDGALVEPTWAAVRQLRIGQAPARHRLVHFSDLHHKGNAKYLSSVVGKINALVPDFVCFTGDLIEDASFLPETLAILSGIQAPMFGVPGNRDYESGMSFEPAQKCFAATGGAWLMDEPCEVAGGRINLIGVTCHHGRQSRLPLRPAAKNILLMHYPAWIKKLSPQRLDLVLAGHSHGGQVRIPFYGPVVLPPAVDEYDLGLFHTESGPLYVNPGIGYLGNFNFRFNCRPEITLIEV